MRKVLQTLSVITAIAALPSAATALDVYGYVANLEAIQEVPPNASTAGGTGIFVIDTVADTISFRIEFGALSSPETGAHIHGVAGPGALGGVLFALPLGNPKVGVWNYPAAFEADILGGRMYVNIHTVVNPAGEIRGQIVTHVATLSGSQEVPANASPATGFGAFVMDPSANTLSYYISYGGLTAAENNAHFHGMAPHGVAGGVVFALPAGSPKVGVWPYLEAQEGAILEGMTYVNIHTVAFGGGEIRGQVVNSLSSLQGLQEVPPNATVGLGIAHHSHDMLGNRLGYFLRFGGLTGAETAAHIHGFAPRGLAAGVKFPYALGSPKNGNFVYVAADEPGIMDGQTYSNVHTAAFGGGEVRGQIEPRFSCWGDVNRDLAVDMLDVVPFVDCLLGAGGCTCADMDFNGMVDGADINDFILALLTT
ncbi:MAG: CHRD domain-containing protein [Planctomycetota bacterium]